MGKFVLGMVLGLLIGLMFADLIFPQGFAHAIEQWSLKLQSNIPGR